MQEIFLFKNPNTFYFLISYIIGSIPSGYLIFKYYRDTDIRNYGSGNIGATNVNRLLGKKLGAITLCFDFLKTLVPSYLAYNYLGTEFGLLCGTFTVIGHMFPLWLKFKGGKGVAVYLGIVLGISFSLGIIFGLTWLLVAIIFRYASLSSIIGSMSVWIYSIFMDNDIQTNLLFIIFIIIIFTHKDNIIRLKNSNENKISFKR